MSGSPSRTTAQSVNERVTQLAERLTVFEGQMVTALAGKMSAEDVESTVLRYISDLAAPRSMKEDLERTSLEWRDSVANIDTTMKHELTVLQETVANFHTGLSERLNKSVESGNTAQDRLKQRVADLEKKMEERQRDGTTPSPAAAPSSDAASGSPSATFPPGMPQAAEAEKDEESGGKAAAADGKGEDPLQHTAWQKTGAQEFDISSPLRARDGVRINLYEQKGFDKRCQKFSNEKVGLAGEQDFKNFIFDIRKVSENVPMFNKFVEWLCEEQEEINEEVLKEKQKLANAELAGAGENGRWDVDYFNQQLFGILRETSS